ncbi:hypothetical protein KAM348_11760 [Aeromonas caviae]|uniref:Uncharacterized protein n=1 Tax=Aeromonas caviae TaxID=648 RepID=A0AAI9KRM9_AERCA|nr:hypothetical protein [Aeromonas caviae]MEA9429043.1 hypothetical protein [Aeromonas caviae]MEA9433609.1 hypothetical protein [Aeromonas caviae]BDA19164.1 hypothetical protein KAM345_030780 [Aeromonas caviae]GJA53753.1 hypothetical protein KAM348_11760 [Aeromonas caviae]
MPHELALSHYSRQWLELVAAKARLQPVHSGKHWLLHITPDSPHVRTVTLQVRWSGVQWQLLTISNADDWRTMNQPVNEICVDPKRRCFWHCQAGPVPLTEQPRVLASFLADLQRICIHRGFTVESDPLPHEEGADDQNTARP